MAQAYDGAVGVDYEVEGRAYRGLLVTGTGAGAARRTGLLMAPNFLGVTEEAVARARMLAGDRYVAFVADVHGIGRQPRGFEDAREPAAALKADGAGTRRLMNAALQAFVQAGRERSLLGEHVAAVGFCLGGYNVLELARSGARLCAAVSIHGDLATHQPVQAHALQADILAIHASEDPLVPVDQLLAFRAEMDGAQAHWRAVVMGRLLHAFTDVGIDVPGVARHDARATREAYALLHAFIAASLEARGAAQELA